MGWQWHQLDHMQIICTSLQTDNHGSTPLPEDMKTTNNMDKQFPKSFNIPKLYAVDRHNTRQCYQGLKCQQEIIPGSRAPEVPTTVPLANDVARMTPADVTTRGTAAPGCGAK